MKILISALGILIVSFSHVAQATPGGCLIVMNSSNTVKILPHVDVDDEQHVRCIYTARPHGNIGYIVVTNKEGAADFAIAAGPRSSLYNGISRDEVQQYVNRIIPTVDYEEILLRAIDQDNNPSRHVEYFIDLPSGDNKGSVFPVVIVSQHTSETVRKISQYNRFLAQGLTGRQASARMGEINYTVCVGSLSVSSVMLRVSVNGYQNIIVNGILNELGLTFGTNTNDLVRISGRSISMILSVLLRNAARGEDFYIPEGPALAAVEGALSESFGEDSLAVHGGIALAQVFIEELKNCK